MHQVRKERIYRSRKSTIYEVHHVLLWGWQHLKDKTDIILYFSFCPIVQRIQWRDQNQQCAMFVFGAFPQVQTMCTSDGQEEKKHLILTKQLTGVLRSTLEGSLNNHSIYSQAWCPSTLWYFCHAWDFLLNSLLDQRTELAWGISNFFTILL